MLTSPTYYISPSGYWLAADGQDAIVLTDDPVGDCIRDACDGESGQCLPGLFPRAQGPFYGKKGFHLCGWPREMGVTTIVRDDEVGGSDNFILGEGDSNFVLECLNIELDDRAGVKTVTGVGRAHALIDVWMYGKGTPHDPLWRDSAKWGVHAYTTAGWNEIRTLKWGIYGEHGGYFHNIQGNHNFIEGGAGYLSGCDLFFANRQNEGPIGKGSILIKDRVVKEACIGQGGSVWTFRGGMPDSDITFDHCTAKLGCDPLLASPWNQNICGVISVDSADETSPGKGDAAWPGGTRSLTIKNGCNFEVGTVYPGRTGMIRPVVQVSALGSFRMENSTIRVKRAPGAYPIGIAFGMNHGSIQFVGDNHLDGWIDYEGTRFTSLDLFRGAYPEFFSP